MSGEQLVTSLLALADWIAVAFAILTTGLIKQLAFKVDPKIIPPPEVTGWRKTLARFMPFVPVFMAVLYIIPTHWGVVTWRVIVNEGIASGMVGAWGYKAVKDALFPSSC
jgi:hypothetical protein